MAAHELLEQRQELGQEAAAGRGRGAGFVTGRRHDVVQVIGGDRGGRTVSQNDGGQIGITPVAGLGVAGRGAERVQDVGDVGIACELDAVLFSGPRT